MQTNATSLLQEIFKHKPGPVFASTLLSWYQKNRRNWPWRIYFEQHRDPYHVWVSEIMLQQTTIQAVLPSYKRFFEIFPKLRDLALADEDAVRLACRGLGYYRRFRMMHAAAKELVDRSGKGPIQWPETFLGWKDLPGIGDYTAAAISSIAFNVPKAVVDGNVERVFCRLFDLRVIPDPKWKKIFQAVGDALIPAESPGDFNQALMELGQDVCTKQKPRCDVCPVASFCAAKREGSQALAPAPKKPTVYEDVRMHIIVPRKGDLIGLTERRSNARFLQGTLGFPTAIEKTKKDWVWESEISPRNAKESPAIGEVKHSITKHRLQVAVHSLESDRHEADYTWVPITVAEERLVSNLDRKALTLLLSRKKTPLQLDTTF